MKDSRTFDLLILVPRQFHKAAIYWMAALLCLVPALGLAQVEIVESYPTIRGNSDQSGNRNSDALPSQGDSVPGNIGTTGNVRPITEISDDNPAANMGPEGAADFYSDYQRLQLEVSQLRGMVEELTNEVKKLKQQRLDDYVELDKRIAELSNGTATVPVASNTGPSRAASNAAATVANTTAAAAGTDEVDSYKAALNMLLQSKDYDGAIAAFQQHLQTYPGGEYEVNVLFWLGQIYVIQGKTAQAENSYSRLIQNFPGHPKAWEARFALGKIHVQRDEKTKASELLQEVCDSGSEVADLACNYIQDNAL